MPGTNDKHLHINHIKYFLATLPAFLYTYFPILHHAARPAMPPGNPGISSGRKGLWNIIFYSIQGEVRVWFYSFAAATTPVPWP
jgi:hypothetical protein